MTFSTNPAHYANSGAHPYDVRHWSSGVQPGQHWAPSWKSQSRLPLPPQDIAFAQACQPGQGRVSSTVAIPMADGELVAVPMSYGGGWGGPAGFWPPHHGPQLPRHQHQRGRSGQPSFRPPNDTRQSARPRLTIDTSPKKHTYRGKGKVSASASASKAPKAFNEHIRPPHMPSQHIITQHIITPYACPNTGPTSITRGMSHLAISGPTRPDDRKPTIPPLASRVSIRPPGYRPPATSPSATPPTLPVTPQGDPEPLVLINSPTTTPSIVITPPPSAVQRVFESTWGITPTNEVEDMFLAHLGGTLDALACGRRWAYVEVPAPAADEEGQGVAVPSHDFDSTNATTTQDPAGADTAVATDTDTLTNTTTTTNTNTNTNTNTTHTHTTNTTTTLSNPTTTTTTTATNTTAHPTRPAFSTRDRAIDTALLNWHLGVRPSLGKGDMRAEFIAAAVGAFRARVGAALAVGLAE